MFTFQFPPCKKYYKPFSVDGERLYACRLHSEMRMKRLKKEGWKWRDGEKHLDYFWDKDKKGCEEKTSELTDECDVKKKPLKRTRT